MPGFELELVDGDAAWTIDLPYGDTVIGRGPYLSVSDKRVSRNHGLLVNSNGKLRLKSTHVNPCFIQASLEEASQPLEKDKWHCLKDGSIFSLLPGKYIYKVHALENESTPTNSQGFEDELEKETQTVIVQKSSQSCEEMLACTPQAKNSLSLTVPLTETYVPDPLLYNQVAGVSPSTSKADKSDPQTPTTKRVLPAWMMSFTPVTPNSTVAKAAAKRVPLQPARNIKPSKRTAGPKQARGTREVSLSVKEDEDGEGEEEECSEVERMPRKRARRLTSDTEDNQDQGSEPKTSQERLLEDKKVNVDEGKKKEDEEKGYDRTENTSYSRTGSSTSVAESSEISQVDKKSSQSEPKPAQFITSSTKTKVQRKTPCPYGASCYRKNPIHFQEFCHPGDDDYEEEQNDKDDDRPECPYGTDCYRKNPLHKTEYKHTKPPAATRSTPDDEDEDHYEDSFINDDSEEEEVDEGSDYMPESGDSEKEDIKLLQKEAKAFQKRKK